MTNVTPPRNPADLSKRAYRILALFVVSVGIFAALYSWVSWQNTKADALRHATELVDIGEKALNSYFSQFAVLLELSGQDLLDAQGRMDPILAQSRLSRLKSVHPDLLNANIVSLDGVILLGTTPGAKLPLPLVDQSSFNESVEEFSKGKTFSIGRPFVGPLSKEWIIPLRYAVRDSGGTLRYVMTATLPLSKPQSVWKDAALLSGMALGLVRDDGYLVSRYPVPAALGLSDVYGKPPTGALIQHLRAQQFPVSGHVEGLGSLDGLNHLVVFRRLSAYPLSFFVTQPLSNVRAIWWGNVRIAYFLLLLLLAGGYAVFRRMLRTQIAREAERNAAESALREMNLDLDRRIEERTGELRESERFNRAALDALSSHIAVLDGNGRIIATNLAWREFAEKNGQLPHQVSEGADYLAACRQAMAMGDEGAGLAATLVRDLIDGVRLEGSFEYPCHAPQEERWFVCRGTRFPGDGPVYVALAHENITARKLAEMDLLKANQELEARVLARTAEVEASRAEIAALVENLVDAIITIDEWGTVLSANPAVERIFGYTLAEILGNNVSLLMPAPHRTAHDGYLQRYLQTGEPRVIGIGREVPGRHKNGDIIPVHLAVSEYRIDGKRYFAGVLRDLRHEKSLTAELRQFRDTLDQALDCIFMFDPDTLQFTYGNRGAKLQVGYSEAELLRMKPFDIEPEFTEARFRELVQPLADGRQQSLHIETVHRHKDGHDIPVEIFLQFVDGEGRQPVFIAVVRDITERKQTEQALVAARDAAELANRAKDSFLATTSHEIRTPLGGLMGMLELLSLTPLNEEQRETLLSARDSGRSLLRILDDLLDWSKIEAGELELSPQPTSIADLVAGVVNTYARVASARSLVLAQEVDAGLSPALIVDPLRLSQILNNFVSNALKFTRTGGATVRAELLGRGEGTERVRFSVTDSGIGIDKEVLPRLFQNYGQGSAETARMYGGTGLGLAICRRLADLLDGRIEVESAPGRGSTFSITLSLPVSEVAAPEALRARSTHESASVPRLVEADARHEAPLVLVVDDHPTNRRLLALQLGLLGLRAETAENGEAALPMWREGRYAAVITDCHMPKMDGYALAQMIRAIETAERRRRTPIIAWTANALAEEENHCQAAGMDDVLVKPTELSELRAALSKWLMATATAARGPIDAGHDGPGGSAGAPIDPAALARIAIDAADQAEILADFMVQTRADCTELEAALHAGDLAASEGLAHRMKGACRMVGARELQAACEALQGAAQRGDAEDARAAHAQLNRAMARLEAHLAPVDDVRKEKK